MGRGADPSGMLLLTLSRFMHCSGVCIGGFEQSNTGCVVVYRPENDNQKTAVLESV